MEIKSLAIAVVAAGIGAGIAVACGATGGIIVVVALAILGLNAAHHAYKNSSWSKMDRQVEQAGGKPRGYSAHNAFVEQFDGGYKTSAQLRQDRVFN